MPYAYDGGDIDFELCTLTYTHLIMASVQDQGFQVLSTSHRACQLL